MTEQVGGVADELIAESGIALSLRDRLRKQREELRQNNRLELLVPGYDGELAVRYKPISDGEMSRFADKINKGDDTGLDAARQMIVLATDCLLVRKDGELVPWRDDDGEPVGFGEQLATMLDIDADRAADVVAEVFSPDGVHPLAVMAHGGALVNWMQGKDLEVDEALLGE